MRSRGRPVDAPGALRPDPDQRADRGVPAIFIIPGAEWEGTSKEEHDALFAKWDHYHQPADEYQPDFPFAGVARYAALGLMIGKAIDR